MKKSNPQILVLSSVSPTVGPAIIGEQIYEALKQKGVDVDFMTKYPEPGHPEYLWVIKRGGFISKLKNRIKDLVRWRLVGGRVKEEGHCFFYSFEKWPPVSSKKVINAIKKQYDLVYVVFDEGKGFDADTTVSIALKDGTRDTDFFKAVQNALDNISADKRGQLMADAVLNQPSGE